MLGLDPGKLLIQALELVGELFVINAHAMKNGCVKVVDINGIFGDVVTEIISNINNTTFDTTINNTLAINAIWGNSPSSADSIYSILFSL
mgnify:CR=1 FL=1